MKQLYCRKFFFSICIASQMFFLNLYSFLQLYLNNAGQWTMTLYLKFISSFKIFRLRTGALISDYKQFVIRKDYQKILKIDCLIGFVNRF